RLLAAVDDLVRAFLPDPERDDLALIELAPAFDGPQARAALEDDDDLLLAHVPVVGVGRLARLDLGEAQSGLDGPRLATEARALRRPRDRGPARAPRTRGPPALG